jgi:hypothetical protein
MQEWACGVKKATGYHGAVLCFLYPSKLSARNKKADTVWKPWYKEFACL